VPYTPGLLPAAPTAWTPGDPFAYERVPVSVTNHTEGTVESYVVRLLTFPSAGQNGQPGNMVTVRYYEDQAAGPKPLVVILPIWGGHPYPPAMVVRDLLAQGRVNVMRVLGADPVVNWDALGRARDPAGFRVEVQRMVERMRASAIDLRRLLDWAETRPLVDTARMAMVGFSESTLQVTAVMASDARLAAAVLVMGGAHPHQIFATCYGPPAAVREQVLPRFGWTAEEFADHLAPVVRPVDPAHLRSRLSPARVLLFDAEDDDCIPAAARDALWNATGRPARVSVRSTHAGSFLAMTFLGGNHIRHRIVEFFTQALQLE
jgi:dienelactone hydrolase